MMIVILESNELIELLEAVRYEHSPEVPLTDLCTTLLCLEIVNELLMFSEGGCSDLSGQITDELLYKVLRARRILVRAVSPFSPIHFRMVDPLGTVAIRID